MCRWFPGLGSGGRAHSTAQQSGGGFAGLSCAEGSSRQQLPRKAHGDLRLCG